MLSHFGVGAATVVVAGLGVGSYRVSNNGVLDAGNGTAYNAWANWQTDRAQPDKLPGRSGCANTTHSLSTAAPCPLFPAGRPISPADHRQLERTTAGEV